MCNDALKRRRPVRRRHQAVVVAVRWPEGLRPARSNPYQSVSRHPRLIDLASAAAPGAHVSTAVPHIGLSKAGAFEFLTKPICETTLLHSLSAAIEHSIRELGQIIRIQDLHQRYDELSGREHEVMRLVVTGRLNKQVGFDLGISEITVKAHRGSVMRKMQAGSLAELVRMVSRLPSATTPRPAQVDMATHSRTGRRSPRLDNAMCARME